MLTSVFATLKQLNRTKGALFRQVDGVICRIAIREGLPYQLSPRMLQRRLALLAEQRRLIAEGQGKGRRYRAPVNAKSVEST